jgi:hypothetical protein
MGGQPCLLKLALIPTPASHPSRSKKDGRITRQISTSRSKPIFLEEVVISAHRVSQVHPIKAKAEIQQVVGLLAAIFTLGSK